MSVYRYYIPGKKPKDVNDDLLSSLGLSERLRDCLVNRHNGHRVTITEFNSRGPDGSSGVMVTPQPFDRKGVPTLKPENMESWKSDKDYWIVWDKTCPPAPEGLRRWDTVSGVVCQLGDGREWECPTIRTCLSPRVPQSYSRTNGQIQCRVLTEYEGVCALATFMSLRLLEQNWETPIRNLFGLQMAFDGALSFLATNYRISSEEAALIGGLINDDAMARIVDAAVDLPFVRDIHEGQKKTGSWAAELEDLRTSLHGIEDFIRDMSQPEETLNSSDSDTQSVSQ